jgi:hypothetical protein
VRDSAWQHAAGNGAKTAEGDSNREIEWHRG